MNKFLLAAALTPHPPILLPEIGRGEECRAASTAAGLNIIAERIAELAPETIVLISPHAPLAADKIRLINQSELRGSMAQFGQPQVRLSFANDDELLQQVMSAAEKVQVPACPYPSVADSRQEIGLDHGAFVPLYFINRKYSDFRLLEIAFGFLPPALLFEFGQILADAIESLGRRTVIIASGDLSHRLSVDSNYGFAPEGPRFDAEVKRIVKSGRLEQFLTVDPRISEAAGECGLRSFQILAGILANCDYDTELLSYQAPWGIGYLTAWVEIGAAEKQLGTDILALARQTVENYVRNGKPPRKRDLSLPPELLERRAACFVTLHIGERLRGCIGTLAPYQKNLAQEIINNAVSACSRDPRFTPVRVEELPFLSYSVDVLSPAEPVASIEDLDPQVYGVIVNCGLRRGVLLPALEGIDTTEEQVDIALQKAGIRPDEPYNMERFEVTRYE
ncbi:MAG: AmmeMemoRadiSam system protein A [Clostridiaceae bacterium]|nr:AmmeMemoRadiSam system protein A [Clostridiaceae bacterium]